MNEAVARMLARYESRTVDDRIQALRGNPAGDRPSWPLAKQVLRESGLLWRHVLAPPVWARPVSEDLDFSLLKPTPGFDLRHYTRALERKSPRLDSMSDWKRRRKQPRAKSSPPSSKPTR